MTLINQVSRRNLKKNKIVILANEKPRIKGIKYLLIRVGVGSSLHSDPIEIFFILVIMISCQEICQTDL